MQQKSHCRLIGVLKELDLVFAALCLTVLILITFLGVIFRYIFNNPISWLEEVQLMLLLWIGFVSAGAAFRAGSHIAIEMVVESLPKGIQRIIEWINRVISLVLLSFLATQCWNYFWLFVKNGRMTPVLRIPYSVIYAVMPLTCVLMILGFLTHEIKAELARSKARRGEE